MSCTCARNRIQQCLSKNPMAVGGLFDLTTPLSKWFSTSVCDVAVCVTVTDTISTLWQSATIGTPHLSLSPRLIGALHKSSESKWLYSLVLKCPQWKQVCKDYHFHRDHKLTACLDTLIWTLVVECQLVTVNPWLTCSKCRLEQANWSSAYSQHEGCILQVWVSTALVTWKYTRWFTGRLSEEWYIL